MKYKLVKIDGYWIIVSDEIAGYTSTCKTYNSDGRIGMAENNQSKIIIASQNPEHNLSSITFSDEVAKELGIVDTLKLGETYFENFKNENPIIPEKHIQPYKLGFIKGYNRALSDNKDKLFTLEDMEAAACFGKILEKFKDDNYKLSDDEEWKGFIQSLTKQEYECFGKLQGNTFLVTEISK